MRVSANSLRHFAALGCLVACMPAQAGRPLVTEDAGVMDKGTCEIETFVQRSRVNGEPGYFGASFEPGCGIGARTQLSLVGRRLDGAPGATLLGLTGKTSLIALSETGIGLTVGYSYEWARSNGESFRPDGGVVIAVATVPFQPKWFAHGNVGWQRTHDPREYSVVWAAAIEREAVGGSSLDLMAEAYRENSATWGALGARYVISETVSINASIAFKSTSEHATRATLGAHISF